MGGGSSGGMSGGSSGDMSGGSAGGMSGGGSGGGGSGGGGGQIRGVSGPVPGPGGAGGTGGTGSDMGGDMAGTNCDPSGTGGWGGEDQGCEGDVGQYPGESDADRKARLEKTLEESVGGFDDVLAEEQKEISTVGRSTEGFGGNAGGAGTGRVGLGKQAGGGAGGGGSGGGAAGEAGSIAGPQEPRESSVAGMSEEEIRARTPDDIPDLVSEDIVAKQLREAALAEDDPVLRERLWDEYRTYNDLNK